ncbi:multicopper oxidase LPR1 homolog 1-like [Triticum dicoccoides]|uniref:multicopper oxidase LPR1 homolog 1-like n=1 Tax=Triticum dicoccoides TaxID=85692 RepID=UPI00188EC456|nr:multicopper oxidase LPR1 homolog 1-like [Triticum dicoccoides]
MPDGMLGKAALAVLLALAGLAAGTRPPPPPVSEDTLEKVAGSLEMYVDRLPQMPKVRGYSMERGRATPVHLAVGMYRKKWKFHRDLPATTVFVFGESAESATFPGPTIEALQGVPLSVTWENHLPENHILPWDPTVPVAIPRHGGVPTVVHLHGGVHPPQSDASAFAWFTAGFRETGAKWTTPTYVYPNVQSPGVLWYHDHALGLTRANLLAGLLGAYVIRNPAVEWPLGLPCGDEFDRVLVLADRSFYANGSLYMNSTGDNPHVHPQWQPEYFGDVITVNGKAWPFLPVARRRYRFRVINASNARYFNLSLSNGLPFHVVGSDTSYLARPVAATHVVVGVSESFDVVIDFSDDESNTPEVELVNTAPYPFPDGNAPGRLSSKVMKFVIEPAKTRDHSRVPARLLEYHAKVAEEEATRKRYIVMYEYDDGATGGPTHLYINGKRLEDPATETPRVGATEVWEVVNLTPDDHPLHLHLATFQAVRARGLVGLDEFRRCMARLNDAARCNVSQHAAGDAVGVPEHERTWKNVGKMAPGHVTTAVVKFLMVDTGEDYPFDATAEPGYVYHCHILDHEDNAMIRPLKLIR